MISFKDIELKDKEVITSYTQNSPRRNCDLSFSNLCSWRFLYDTQFAVQDGFLILKFWAGEKLVYMMPVGNGDLKKVLENMIEDATQEGERFCMLGIMLITCICALILPHWQVRNSRLNETISTNSGGLTIMNTSPSPPTAYRSVLTWKPNGAK